MKLWSVGAAAVLLAVSWPTVGLSDSPERATNTGEGTAEKPEEQAKKTPTVHELLRQLRETRKKKGGRVSEVPHNPGRRRAFPIYKVWYAQREAWDRGDMDSFMKGYWKSDELRLATDVTVIKGWQAASDFQREQRHKLGELNYSFPDISMLSEDTALFFGRWEVKGDGVTPEGLFTLLFQRIDDSWVIVHEHISSE